MWGAVPHSAGMKTCDTQHVTVAVVEPDTVIRHGFREFISRYSCFKIGWEYSSIREAESDSRMRHATVMLIDPQIDGDGGLHLIHRLSRNPPAPACVAWLRECTESAALSCIRAGARGVVCRREPLEELALTLLAVSCGYSHLSTMIAPVIGDLLVRSRFSPDETSTELPPRQRQVFQMLGTGMVPTQIAGRLGISLKSIQTHIERLKTRLNCRSQSQLVRQAILSSGERREAAGRL